jgi:ferritin-like protein
MTITAEQIKTLNDGQLDEFMELAKTEMKTRFDAAITRMNEQAAKHGIQVGSVVRGRRGRKAAK